VTRVVVTGGSGFIGRATVLRLRAAGHDVVVYDLVPPRWLAAAGAPPEWYVRGDVRDREDVVCVIHGATHVVHLAAEVSVPGSVRDPWTTWSVNVDGTLAVLEASRSAGVSRVVVASSSAVYGDKDASLRREDEAPAPRSPYAASKLAAEQLAVAWDHAYGLSTASLRFFNVFGPGQADAGPYTGVITAFARDLRAGAVSTIHWDGRATRDFVHVDDVAAAIELVAFADASSLPRGAVLNVGRGEAITISALHEMMTALIARRSDAPPSPSHGPARDGDIEHSVADVSAIARAVGWSPQTTLRDGLAALLADTDAAQLIA
jgi:UDP-glucose 4-epimerase